MATVLDMVEKESRRKIKRKSRSGSKTSKKLDKKGNRPDKSQDKPMIEVAEAYVEARKFLQDNGISISTITINCSLGVDVDIESFAKYVVLTTDGVVSIKFGNRKNLVTNRTIVQLKPKKKPSKKNFYNQSTILMKPMNNLERNYLNIKVFRNGSIHVTGCKDLDDLYNVINTLIDILKKGRKITTKKGKVRHVNFVKDTVSICLQNVHVRMINSNFRVDYKIDRKKLALLLKKHHGPNTKDTHIGPVEYKYKPNGGHSGVNIKYHHDEKNRPSIFVFQTGAIIITGAKTLNHIIMAYHFINKIIEKYHDEIRIVTLDTKVVQDAIYEYFKMRNRKLKNAAKITKNLWYSDFEDYNPRPSKKTTSKRLQLEI